MPRSNCYETMALAIGNTHSAELGIGGLGRTVAKFLERGGIRPDWLEWDFSSRLNEDAYGDIIIRFNQGVEVRHGKISGDEEGEQNNGYHIVKILSNIFDDGCYGIVSGEYDNLGVAIREGLLLSVKSFMSMGLA